MFFFFPFLIFPLCQESRYSIWRNIFPSILFRAKMSEHEATYTVTPSAVKMLNRISVTFRTHCSVKLLGRVKLERN